MSRANDQYLTEEFARSLKPDEVLDELENQGQKWGEEPIDEELPIAKFVPGKGIIMERLCT